MTPPTKTTAKRKKPAASTASNKTGSAKAKTEASAEKTGRMAKARKVVGEVADTCAKSGEEAKPQVERVVEDMQGLWTGMLEASFGVQRSLVRSVGLDTKLVDLAEGLSKDFSEAGFKMQKEFVAGSVEFATQVSRSLGDRAKEKE